MLRRFHRWFGLITGLFMIVISLTGIGIQTLDFIGGNLNGGGARRPIVGAPSNSELFRQHLHQLFERIHNGEFAGLPGRIVSVLMGLALLYFSISGTWMYWTMFQSRRKTNRREIFW